MSRPQSANVSRARVLSRQVGVAGRAGLACLIIVIALLCEAEAKGGRGGGGRSYGGRSRTRSRGGYFGGGGGGGFFSGVSEWPWYLWLFFVLQVSLLCMYIVKLIADCASMCDGDSDDDGNTNVTASNADRDLHPYRCYICNTYPIKGKLAWCYHRRACSQTNRAMLAGLKTRRGVRCHKCVLYLKQMPASTGNFHCDGGLTCTLPKDSPITNNGQNRFNCFDCDFDLCQWCAQREQERLDEPSGAGAGPAAGVHPGAAGTASSHQNGGGFAQPTVPNVLHGSRRSPVGTNEVVWHQRNHDDNNSLYDKASQQSLNNLLTGEQNSQNRSGRSQHQAVNVATTSAHGQANSGQAQRSANSSSPFGQPSVPNVLNGRQQYGRDAHLPYSLNPGVYSAPDVCTVQIHPESTASYQVPSTATIIRDSAPPPSYDDYMESLAPSEGRKNNETEM